MMDGLVTDYLLASLFNYRRMRSNHFMCTLFHTRQPLNLTSGSLQFTSEPKKSNNLISIDDGADGTEVVLLVGYPKWKVKK